MTFLACRIYKTDNGVEHRLEQIKLDALCEGEVVIKVHYSGVNYKDALGATGRGQILKQFPLNGGIDLAGVVESSTDERFTQGDEVIVNGCGLGESHDGGLAEMARVPADWVMPLPEGLSLLESMILGTAGFTAALAIHRMLENHQNKEQGPIAVTGASGGVGSVAVDILSSLGFETIAVSGRQEYYPYLTELGASQVCSPDDLELGGRPLEKSRFGGAIDNVGGKLLSQLIAHTNLWGNVASIGLADSHKLDATVFPFILRGVSLLGVSSTNCPMSLRKAIWQRLGKELKPKHLNSIVTETVPLSQVSSVFNDLLDRKKHGRVVIDCKS
ncbi:YhdH/YhfP family quinone oxidoreductase [Aliikangiella coralliicola]|uniref:Acryloyl-CoA reductase n=1 Tax=Aliikangiella coralliicola TaxID=2592383 RepID=A0A545TSV5_9GAMM|nr:YhdH/YhfP family quinone oxidoreductase [Aliikangiella coralliicola]TQV80292.1 acryloyl-CoA reductase [Aliikangiella coralliicola]